MFRTLQIYMLFYLFGGAGRSGEDGLPVRPYEHDKRQVEEDQVDNWRETISTASASTTEFNINTDTKHKKTTINY